VLGIGCFFDIGLIMTRLFLFVLLLLFLYVILHYLIRDMPVRRKRLNRESESEELVQDPNCQTYIPKKSAVKKKIAGRLFYFCNQTCMEHYVNEIKKNQKKG
jgi:YHS domain-containing protein